MGCSKSKAKEEEEAPKLQEAIAASERELNNSEVLVRSNIGEVEDSTFATIIAQMSKEEPKVTPPPKKKTAVKPANALTKGMNRKVIGEIKKKPAAKDTKKKPLLTASTKPMSLHVPPAAAAPPTKKNAWRE